MSARKQKEDIKTEENVNIQRIVRIRQDYFKVCSYLDFVAKRGNKGIGDFYDELFIYSLNYISNKGFKYFIIPYKPRRTPKGFSMTKETSKNIDLAYEFYSKSYSRQHKERLYIADFIELLVYIYCVNNLTEYDLNSIGIDFGIEKLE